MATSEKNSTLPQWAISTIRWIDKYAALIVVGVGTVAAGVLSAIGASEVIRIWIFAALVVSTGGTIWQHRRSEYAVDLESSLDAKSKELERSFEAVSTATRGIGRALLESIEMYDDDTRISIYCHDDRAGHLICIGRESSSPELRKFGGPYYRDDEGTLGKCWNERVGSYQGFPRDSPEAWVEKCVNECNMTRERARGVKFKAGSGYFLLIEYQHRPIGIVAIEGRGKTKVVGRTIKPLLKTELFNVLGEIIFLTQDEFLANG